MLLAVLRGTAPQVSCMVQTDYWYRLHWTCLALQSFPNPDSTSVGTRLYIEGKVATASVTQATPAQYEGEKKILCLMIIFASIINLKLASSNATTGSIILSLIYHMVHTFSVSVALSYSTTEFVCL